MVKSDKFIFGFGVGSFIFYTSEHKMLPSKFLKQLEIILKEQTNISDIKISIEQDVLIGVNAPAGSFYNPIECHPRFAYGNIEFIVYLPEKNQQMLSPLGKYCKTFGNERFYVRIEYNNGLPIVFVRPIGISKKCAVSWSVVIIREYLEKIFKDSAEIKFKIQAPSPAHLEIFVFSDDMLEDTVNYEYKETISYDEINIIFNPKKIKQDDLINIICDCMSESLGQYYLWETKCAYVLDNAYDFLSIYDELLEKTNKYRFYKYSNLPKYIQQAFLKLANYEINNIRLKNFSKEVVNAMGKSEKLGKMPIAKGYIANKLNNEGEAIELSKPFYDTLSFLEGRYQNYSQIIMILFSTVIGCLIGGFISMVIKQ